MRAAVIGAGPAGLTAAYALTKAGVDVEVFEAGAQVGGMARSFDLWGHRVDLGPHRFFSKDARVNRLWLEIMGSDYRMVERQTRILYRKRLFDYPLKARNALANMGALDATRCLLSYMRAKSASATRTGMPDDTFEDWVVGRFGRRLFEMFFKSYSEKLWGIPCSELNADFAAQRIKGFSLGQALIAMTGFKRGRHRTLADVFAYPKGGNGEVYARMAKAIVAAGGKVHLSCPVERVETAGKLATGVRLGDGSFVPCDHVITTKPLTSMVQGLPDVPPVVTAALARLRFRNTIIVYLLVENAGVFTDQWLYVHSPDLLMGRVTNFRNWVPELYGSSSSSILALEYWCNDEDSLWRDTDNALIERAKDEIVSTGLVESVDLIDGKVVRVPRCYPVYSRDYKSALEPVIGFLKAFPNLWPIGRYGSFKYNNQDHSILMGLLAAENIAGGTHHDLWAVNNDDSYQEEAIITDQGLVTTMNRGAS